MKRQIFFALFSLFSFTIFAQNDFQFPSLEPLFLYEQKDEFSGEDFIRVNLELSLCPQDSENGQKVLNQFKNLEEQVRSDEFMSLDEYERGEKILSLIYEKVLTQYNLNQSFIDRMFQTGTYNCISSSILYFALAKSAGLNVVGNETPDHAFCSIYLSDGRKIDVETTNPNGFNPGIKKTLPSNSANSKRYYIVPKRSYNNRKEISDKKFITLIGKNVVSYLDRKSDFAKSVPLAAARLGFVETASETEKKSLRSDFDMAVINYAVFLDHAKKSKLAVEWLESVENRWGKPENLSFFQKNYDGMVYNAAVNFIREGKAEEAKEFFEVRKEKIAPKNQIETKNTIFLAIIDQKTKKMKSEEAISFLQEQRKSEEASEKSVSKKIFELEEFYWSERIKPFTSEKKYLEAAAILDEGLKSLPTSRNLSTIKGQVLNNYAVGVHNRFVKFYNAKDFENAEKVALEGLENLPKNGTLLNDLKLARSQKK